MVLDKAAFAFASVMEGGRPLAGIDILRRRTVGAAKRRTPSEWIVALSFGLAATEADDFAGPFRRWDKAFRNVREARDPLQPQRILASRRATVMEGAGGRMRGALDEVGSRIDAYFKVRSTIPRTALLCT